ncbi:hypothetical protein BDK92_3369 [Micromonospora pisi]|uniref:Uncharacterized protein n=1 Tax=Micromonospora pisi TaxID=589240 RepID=A0A495JL07_9ACTN|nr:hypothetical protein BDK92_3369 [Micromonospora pisi]
MSRNDEPLTPAGIWWSAGMTITGHTGGRRCPQCRPDGCDQLAWAIRQRRTGKPISPVPVLLRGVAP